MKADQFTEKSREAFDLAIAIAARRSNPEVVPPHLLVALLEQADSLVAPLLANPTEVRAQANAALDALPPDVLEKGGIEILRASVVDGAVSVALRRSFDDPFTWGVLFVDLARHAARIYALETELSEEQALEAIAAGFRAELEDPTDEGSTSALN